MADGRKLIVCDVETTGLSGEHVILEVAAVPLRGVPIHFVPYVSHHDMADADPDALRINRYFERGVYRSKLSQSDTREQYSALHNLLDGNVFGGSNPRFDVAKLAKVFRNYGFPWEPSHHRLADLSVYAAGVLSIPVEELPGLDTVCELLGVVNREPHSAMGDAQATADCFRILMGR